MSRSLHINNRSWELFVFDEKTLLLSPSHTEDMLTAIHQATKIFEQANISEILDIIPAYESIALCYDHVLIDIEAEVKTLQQKLRTLRQQTSSPQHYEIPVCYELGLDWQIVEQHSGFSKEKIIKIHSGEEYVVASMGFTPGFVYLEGMDSSISTRRKEKPRTEIPAGSVGIGGNQTGFYGLKSPGGWQIIGRTPNKYFEVDKEPPGLVDLGDRIRFKPISKEEFETQWNKKPS